MKGDSINTEYTADSTKTNLLAPLDRRVQRHVRAYVHQ